MLSIFYKQKFETHEALYKGLKQESSAAWQQLAQIVTPFIHKLGRKHELSHEDIEDLISVSVMRHLECFRADKYKFNGSCPSYFTYAIAVFRVKDYWNVKSTEQLEQGQHVSTADNSKQVEINDLLERIFSKMSKSDVELLRLTYQEGIPDKDLVDRTKVGRGNEKALRTTRKRARKKFKELAELFMTLLLFTTI